ncbi:hypothetical protein GQ54DRAFT_189750 [Martensiomyces pterosporus]|nr:hypothetical protein GQ54DRAFT_189750 [Martensiomyces pterosporus]
MSEHMPDDSILARFGGGKRRRAKRGGGWRIEGRVAGIEAFLLLIYLFYPLLFPGPSNSVAVFYFNIAQPAAYSYLHLPSAQANLDTRARRRTLRALSFLLIRLSVPPL